MQAYMLRGQMTEGALRAVADVSRETAKRLDEFVSLLTRWNGSLNLVSRRDIRSDFKARHINEALDIVAHLPERLDRLVDLGSGAGLPAIPIAIATGISIDLVEADLRKAAFLHTAMAKLALTGRVWSERIEGCPADPAACITARALAPLSKLLAYTFPLLQPGGIALFLKGDQAEAEIATARQDWQMDVQIEFGALSNSRILKISRLKPLHDVAAR